MQISPNLHFQVSYKLTSDDLWPWFVTFDRMNIWRFHIISINQVWFKSDFNFSNEAIFTFSAYLSTWPQMTFDLGTWPLSSSTIYDPTLVEIHQSMWKIEPNVNPFSQQTTTTSTENINRQQQQGTKWSLYVFPAKAFLLRHSFSFIFSFFFIHSLFRYYIKSTLQTNS